MDSNPISSGSVARFNTSLSLLVELDDEELLSLLELLELESLDVENRRRMSRSNESKSTVFVSNSGLLGLGEEADSAFSPLALSVF